MFDNIQYGNIPLFIQNYILKIGLEHPTAFCIKSINIPEVIYSKYKMSFSDHFFLFYNCNGKIFEFLLES
tara:strand:+ start:5800 stop:6009 length:210 start_codon:yes stop_codon:yes gene_type:complete